MKEKRKLLLNEHVNVGLLASEIFNFSGKQANIAMSSLGSLSSQSLNQSNAIAIGHARCPRFREFACFYFKFKKFCQIM